MTVYRYVDTADGSEYDPTAKTYSVMQLIEEHTIRYVFRTGEGAIILRHLPLRMKRILDSVIAMMYPNYFELSRELNSLREGIVDVRWEDVDPEAQERFLKVASQMKPIGQMYALGVIEEPRIATMDEFYGLYERLTEDEQERLDMLIQELTSVRDPSTVDDTALKIAERYGIDVIDREMLEQMTVSQASYFMSIIAKENDEINRMMKKDERLVR